MREDRSLELDDETMRRLIDLARDRVVAHINALPDMPAADVDGGLDLARSLDEPAPENGVPYDRLLDLLFERVIPKSLLTPGPGYMAYIPGGGLYHSAVADYIANATNRFVGTWFAAPGLAKIEANVVRWFADWIGYGPGSGGVLTSGGSLANLTAIATARRTVLKEAGHKGTMYVSDQGHHSLEKSAVIAGIAPHNVRKVPVDHKFRIQVDALEALIRADIAAKKKPFLIVGNAGTTNTGAVDDLDKLANVAARHNLWLHADAAYGGFFALTERGRKALHGIERADSVTLDPHKGLFLPYGTGCLLVRTVARLRAAHAASPGYFPARENVDEMADFSELSSELSRDWRGLRAWLPLKMHGVGVFRTNLDEKMDLAHWAADEVAKLPDVRILARPELSLFAFRAAPRGLDRGGRDRLNRAWQDGVNARGRVHITGTTLRDGFALRVCILSFRTHKERVAAAIEDLRTTLRELRAPRAASAPQAPRTDGGPSEAKVHDVPAAEGGPTDAAPGGAPPFAL